MVEKEGVIKYRLEYQDQELARWVQYEELNAWRGILFGLCLIGQDDERYGGYGYGNISCRVAPGSDDFYISGTQTGEKSQLSIEDYCHIVRCDVKKNHIVAKGSSKPSSEAMSHDAVYQLDPKICCVIHVHSDVLWRCADLMGLPCTNPNVAYGTVDMAEEILRLHRSGTLDSAKLFSMKGHQDGIFSFGHSIEQAGANLISTLSLAIQHYK